MTVEVHEPVDETTRPIEEQEESGRYSHDDVVIF
jgi:hypothetical protein